ncbi:MAG TPA: pyrroline-5-carboxylate reductase [Acidocella sp.]|uniref:pyrroline-5-carboxylate reductase n=1 Tax=Acidocella sp. TaxID=50710 RepID=UPI002C7CFDFD|nr:pyrroline-5-carboxylate reductase [Acidocella sp.]HVE23429.1 pyrroline-5-carboxylate reductase [Acidocella sp.]
MTTSLPSLLLIGGGRMGGAMLAGWREQGCSAAVVVDPAPGAASLAGDGVTVVASVADIPAGFVPEAVVLAVKPQMAAEVLPSYARFAGHAVFISIMAGKTIHAIGAMLGVKAAIVRAMPNTPAAVRQGITVAVSGAHVSDRQKELAQALLTATGACAWVAAEDLLDPVTAISGGGPAYVFLLTELLEQAGLDQGLPPALARQMARQTVIGSAALLAASEEDAADLRIAVTSPKGTTERALAVLRADDGWPKIFREAIQAATDRSRELSA